MTRVFLPFIIGSISFLNALASSDKRTSCSINDLINSFNASMFSTASPIPMAAESIPAGICPRSLFTEPRVSFESARGITIRSGDAALVACAFTLGTAV